MAYFAKMDGNTVLKVVVVHNNELLDENGNESEAKGIEFLKKTFGQDTSWLKTSFGSKNGKHYHIDPNTGIKTLSEDQSKCFRKTFVDDAMPGTWTYDPAKDAFIPPKDYPTWIFDEASWMWIPPVPHPTGGEGYDWNEENQSWDPIA
jgi:hypothetical protein|tara:strand:+ start:59 stop:502 length:444 start_codon:yes stop_codon:yes gene_type:complete